MRAALSLSGAAALLVGFGMGSANALPGRLDAMRALTDQNLVRVQLVCTPASCIDQRTGAYTQSSCSYRGCRPIGGIVGYVGGWGGPRYRQEYYGPRGGPYGGYYDRRGRGYGPRPHVYHPPAPDYGDPRGNHEPSY